MRKNVHVVAHSHWDREWYFTTSRSKVYLQKDLGDVLSTLEKNPEFHSFLLDGQSCLIDDYLAWKPEDEERVKALVEAGRLVVGPWYTQSDQMLPSGESIVRNLYYGMRRAQEMGACMKVAYVPDSFGQAGNMPQIYRQAGLTSTLFWRGVSDDMVKKTDFWWRGDDGTRILASQIPHGYYIGGNIPEETTAARSFWQEECLDRAGGRSATSQVYFPVGFDQAPIRTNLPELVGAQVEADPENGYRLSSLEEFMDDLADEAGELEEVTGELLVGKNMRIHRSIFSSRSDLKAMNTRAQNYIVNIMEPLLLLSSWMGNEYPHGAVDAIWKLMFENAAHDSIGSSVVDEVNEDIYLRYKQVEDIATSLVELHGRLIVTAIEHSDRLCSLTAFNLLPQERSAVALAKVFLPGEHVTIRNSEGRVVPYTIVESRDLTDYVLAQTIRLNPSAPIDLPRRVHEATVAVDARNVPALGYERYVVEAGGEGELALGALGHLENEFYCVEVNADGSLRVTCKEDGTIYDRQAVLVENGDDGDSFNYSPPRADLRVFSTDCPVRVTMEGSSLWQRACIAFDMQVPASLEERAEGVRSAAFPVELEVTLAQGARTIGLEVHIDNREPLSHRLCILFDAQMAAKVNYADEQFGTIVRDNMHEEQMGLYNKSVKDISGLGDNKSGDVPVNWSQHEGMWQEPPLPIEPTQSFVALFDEVRGLAVFPQGVREYQILDDDLEPNACGGTICLTLFRTYGFMGKENLLYRPGRASGEVTMKTPAAQLRKKMTFNLGVALFATGFDEAHVAQVARCFNTPISLYEYAPFLNGRIVFSQEERVGTGEPCGSLLACEGGLVVSSMKRAEARPGVIVRLYNAGMEGEDAYRLHFANRVAYASRVDLLEEDLAPIPFDGDTVEAPALGRCEFVTIYVELEEDEHL